MLDSGVISILSTLNLDKATMLQGPMLLVVLFLAIALIVVLTSKFKVHPLLALLIACYGIGFAVKIPVQEVSKVISIGFGEILSSIGLVIIFGTIIGVILEKSGGAVTMADSVLRVVGKKRPSLAMSIIGYIVSIPVFCDSGFVILNSLKNGMARRAKKPILTLSIALATGLYATHTFIPPTPGPIAAAGNLGLSDKLGMVILFGAFVAAIATIVGWMWAKFIGAKLGTVPESQLPEDLGLDLSKYPRPLEAFAPILIPIVLIATSTIVAFATGKNATDATGFVLKAVFFLGQPLNALLIGLALSLILTKYIEDSDFSAMVNKGLRDAALILVITGAGGALGKVLKVSPIGDYLGETLTQYNIGIFLPFIIAAALKTAQGSSTVAIVTTSSIVAPLLVDMGLGSTVGRTLAVMATGAGAMTVSHANDSFFWVVTEFSGLDVKTAYKSMTVATLLQGVVSILVVAVLAYFFV